ncbi:hotdog fold thioesterase [Streptomyces exfoliatus]|uniref:hotdog fold thioesterase n=1 Tax=Streptomyces exfoliatus TaxID=1905 RepID=UPI003C30262A
MESTTLPTTQPGPDGDTTPRMLQVPPHLADKQLALRMGIEIVSWDPKRLIGTMPVEGNQQPFGWLHGGANAVLAETLGSVAASLHAATKGTVAGLELSCTHHRPARSGLVTGVCTPLHLGSRVATYEIAISDEQGHLTCSAKLTCVINSR